MNFLSFELSRFFLFPPKGEGARKLRMVRSVNEHSKEDNHLTKFRRNSENINRYNDEPFVPPTPQNRAKNPLSVLKKKIIR